MIATGKLFTNPQGNTTAGCPVRFVTSKLALPGAGLTNTSHCDINFSISRISSVRARCARRYSTAGINRDVRNVLGQSFGDCPDNWLTRPSRVMSSNAVAASADKMNLRDPVENFGNSIG